MFDTYLTREKVQAYLDATPRRRAVPENGVMCFISKMMRELYAKEVIVGIHSIGTSNNDRHHTSPPWMAAFQQAITVGYAKQMTFKQASDILRGV